MSRKIFALEGEWSSRLNNPTTIKSALQFLEETEDIEFIYRRTSVIDSLEYYLTRLAKYTSYSVVYFAFHGSKSLIELEDKSITLKKIATILGNSLKDKHVLFGSCKTAVDQKALKDFKKETGAMTVSDFSKNIDFFEGTMIDMALLKKVYHQKKPKNIKTLPRQFNSLVEMTGFVLV